MLSPALWFNWVCCCAGLCNSDEDLLEDDTGLLSILSTGKVGD